MSSPRIVFAGGGSGGHLMPGVAVAEELARRFPGCDIHFVTSLRGIDSRVLSDSAFARSSIPMLPVQKRPTEFLRFVHGFGASLREMQRFWRATPPDLVVGLGGFSSVPAGLTAWRKGTPLVLLEQNVVPGRATSLLAPLAAKVCVSFAETVPLLRCSPKAVVTGNPVREAVRQTTQNSPKDPRQARRVLLVLGGSQGASGLNSMVVRAVARLRSSLTGWRIVHQTGERDAARIRAAYRQLAMDADVAAYFDDLPHRYCSAQLVVSRAGATTLAELACCGLPALLVPYPGSARNHQDRNAALFVQAGAACKVQEAATAAAALAEALATLIDDSDYRNSMAKAMHGLARTDATAAVANVILAQLGLHSARGESARRAA